TGSMDRVRSCPPGDPLHHCRGHDLQRKQCFNTTCPVDGGWSDWSRWSPCSSQCGSGEQTRDRLCNSPAPQHGGLSCSGPHIQSRDCNSQPCSGTHTLWVGVQIQTQPCPMITFCCDGSSTRKRACTNPPARFGGVPCSGARRQTRASPGCRVDGAWGQWGPWTGCSLSCGGGEKLRKRLCDNPPPEGGARGCVGVAEQQKACNTQQCTGDSGGPWWSWSQWSVCSVSCGGGQQARSRLCRSEPCVGVRNQSKTCNTHVCLGESQHMVLSTEQVQVSLSRPYLCIQHINKASDTQTWSTHF
uniref:PROP n=1 Tax=Gouania willdenowi TaxID=441366 RepID=A0A8C5F0R6_GOUWI